jgi:hypothetical protein
MAMAVAEPAGGDDVISSRRSSFGAWLEVFRRAMESLRLSEEYVESLCEGGLSPGPHRKATVETFAFLGREHSSPVLSRSYVSHPNLP